MLEIKDLYAGFKKDNVTENILEGISISVKAGEVHAIMGPNGSGKSTLSKVIVGYPDYELTGGSVLYEGSNLLDLEPDERALRGIFLAYQYPVEIPGVNNAEFIRMAYNSLLKSRGEEEVDPLDFADILNDKMKLLGMDDKYKERSVNEGFSGGEKKKNEILQMAILKPKLSILDEIDSGLDIDALKVVANSINKIKSAGSSLIVITHFPRILEYIEPEHVHVLNNGKIISSGDKSLAHELEEKGYDFLLSKKAI